MNSVFALVDCNNFYVSCERLFQPKLAGRPVVVLSNNDGCIIARSNEAKALGIAMGAPYFKTRPLIKRHRVRVFSSNYTLYGDLSSRVMAVLQEQEPEVEIYSIDEAFLRLPESGAADLAGRLRSRIKKDVGLPVSIGIGPTKTLAKIANRVAKTEPRHHGVFALTDPKLTDTVLAGVPTSDIWGIGRRTSEKLLRYGITTGLELKNCDDAWIRKQLTVVGLRTVFELRGIPCIPIGHEPVPRKSLVCSRSFRYPVTSLRDLREAVAGYISTAARRLRSEGLRAGNLHVFLRTDRHRPDLPQHSESLLLRLDRPTSSTPLLIKKGLRGLATIYRQGFGYRKAGIMLTELNATGMRQQHLFTHSPRDDHAVMEALDSINARWGRDTIRYAASGLHRSWSMSREHVSPAYTTSWDELPVVKASS